MLFELIYHSQTSENTDNAAIDEIIDTSRIFNGLHGITGCLLYHNGQFLQILEGEFQTLNDLYNRIRKDTRHKNVVTLHMQEISDRLFANWKMAFQRFEDGDSLQTRIGIKDLRHLLNQAPESRASRDIFERMSRLILESH